MIKALTTITGFVAVFMTIIGAIHYFTQGNLLTWNWKQSLAIAVGVGAFNAYRNNKRQKNEN